MSSDASQIPPVAPAAVLNAIGVASQAYDQLAASGRQLHFHTDEQTGRVSVQVHDTRGNLLGTLAPSQMMEVAAGGTLR